MNIIWTILVGFIIGLVARAVMPGRDPMGFIFTTLLGVVGAMVAQFAGQGMGWYAEGEPAGFIASVAGALIVLFIGHRVRRTAI